MVKETAPTAFCYFYRLRLFDDDYCIYVFLLLEPPLFLELRSYPPMDGFREADPLPCIASGLAFGWEGPIFITDVKAVWYLSSYLRCALSRSYCWVAEVVEVVPTAAFLLLLLFCILFAVDNSLSYFYI